MPDWKPLIRARLLSVRLDAARENEIVEELSQHLDDAYRELRSGGASHAEAMRMAVEEIDDRGRLARERSLVPRDSVS